MTHAEKTLESIRRRLASRQWKLEGDTIRAYRELLEYVEEGRLAQKHEARITKLEEEMGTLWRALEHKGQVLRRAEA